MKWQTFGVVTSISLVMAIAAAILSLVGLAVTGFYPGMIVLLLLPLIPFASRIYGKKMLTRSTGYQVNYYAIVTVINLILIFVVLWMSFVIVHDRVLKDCC